jgi:hypothetical protein
MKTKTTNQNTWGIIDKIAKTIGVSDAARAKWRQRHVPHKYRIQIIEQARAEGFQLSASDFDPVASESKAA